MTTFNIPVERTKKPESAHPWQRSINNEFAHKIQRAHNSVKNVVYPKPKEKVLSNNRVKYTVYGNRISKEFLYCVQLVQGMHKYRSKVFDAPVIQAYPEVEWSSIVLKRLQAQYGALAHCLQGQVAVVCNDNNLIGGEEELRKLIETKYYIHLLALNYEKESIQQFSNFIKSTGRPCVYLHISINEKPIGSLIFMLYSDVVPRTCENFLRLCRCKRGGYSGTPVHRVVKDGWIQCGGFGLRSVDMDCENFIVPHDRRGVLAMANAGRHLDCSTQFFVLLQPKRCFKFRFVAFGQLIDGEETLKKIEEVETFYEAPTASITIYSAGVINLDCPDVKINKDCRVYIEKHIDDLIIVGEMFYEMLIDKVFLEIEFRRNKKYDVDGEYYGEAYAETVDAHGNYIPDNIHATRRFIRKKEEMDTNADDKSQVDTQERTRRSTMSRHSKITKHKEDEDAVNNDFDVESFSACSEEQYSYSQVTPSQIVTKQTKPYYLAMTDVPYPGEIDSNFDLRRFLQGDYCLESDLQKHDKKVLPHKKWFRQEKMKAVSQIMSSYAGVMWFTESSSSSENSDELESDDEREIKSYLERYVEKVSFAGSCVKKIAQRHILFRSLETKPLDERYTDEELRRIRLALQDMKSRENKKLSIAVEPWETHTQIKRRQTGFVKPQEWVVKDMPEEEEEEDFDKSEAEARKVSVTIHAPNKISAQIKRRQTGFVAPEDLNKLMVFHRHSDEESPEEVQKKIDDEETGVRRKTGVRIAPQSMNTREEISVGKTRRSTLTGTGETSEKSRPSVLMRLYEDVALDVMEATPTLKDYKPLAEKSKKFFLFSDNVNDNPLLRRNEKMFHSPPRDESSEEIPNYQRKRSIPGSRKASSDIGQEPAYSIRSVEYARTRPSVTVSQYQMMNNLAEEKRKKETSTSEDSTSFLVEPKQFTSRGIRLPGDSPVYDHLPSDQSLHPHGTHGSKIILNKIHDKHIEHIKAKTIARVKKTMK